MAVKKKKQEYTSIVAQLNESHALVWRVRKYIREQWPTPNQVESLRFAVTEGGEAIQAHMVAALAMAWENSFAQQGLSLNQAYTYACEALDGDMRSKVKFARNRDKVIDIADELTDCAMMLLTALGPTWEAGKWIDDNTLSSHHTLESICQMVSASANHCHRHPEHYMWRIGAEGALAAICILGGFDLKSTLYARLDRITRKHTGAKLETVLGAPVPAWEPVGV